MEEVRVGEHSERVHWRRREARTVVAEVLRRLLELQFPDDFDNWKTTSVSARRVCGASGELTLG